MNTKVSFLKVLHWNTEQCRSYLEKMRWPKGAICPKCGAREPWRITRKTPTKNAVQTLFKCKSCKKQFTATVGTIFEDSKIPLNKWFAAIYLMCASKKGISAHQIHRQLDITYKSAWYLCHRVRAAMQGSDFTLLKGTIEADETYVGGKTRGHWTKKERINDEIKMGLREKHPHPRMEKAVVFGMLERDGNVRTMHVPQMNQETAQAVLTHNIDLSESRLVTDAHHAYKMMKERLPHDVIKHEEEYVNGDIHTQGIEGYWSLLKRGIYGVFHHVSKGFLSNYLNEFEFRFNRRKITDQERFSSLVGQTQGRLLWYCQTPQPENPYA